LGDLKYKKREEGANAPFRMTSFSVTLRRKPKGLLLFCHFEGGQSPEESLIAGFKEKKEERRGFFGC